jgi:hypothetical protein
MNKDIDVGVHQSHCCAIHGCKYGEDDCPVVTKKIIQDHICVDCEDDNIKTVDEICKRIESGLKPCPFCGSIDLDYFNNREGNFWIHCKNCKGESGIGKGKEEAKKVWNMRKR